MAKNKVTTGRMTHSWEEPLQDDASSSLLRHDFPDNVLSFVSGRSNKVQKMSRDVSLLGKVTCRSARKEVNCLVHHSNLLQSSQEDPEIQDSSHSCDEWLLPLYTLQAPANHTLPMPSNNKAFSEYFAVTDQEWPLESDETNKFNPPDVIVVQSGETARTIKDVELRKPQNARGPSVRKVKKDQDSEEAVTQELFRQMCSILNKLTPEKFERLMKEIKRLSINTVARLEGIGKMVLDKAICEVKFASTYAKMCCKLKELEVPVCDSLLPLDFHTVILDLCQVEFRKVTGDGAVLEKEWRNHRAAKGEDRQYWQELKAKVTAHRKQAVGSMKFIGELFRLGMVKDAVILEYVTELLDTETEEAMESLCCLITTTGSILDSEELKPEMDRNFSRIESILQEKKFTSRVSFMLQDLMDVRQNNWVPRRKEQGPKTIDQVHKEVEKESQLAHEEGLSKPLLSKRAESRNTTPEKKLVPRDEREPNPVSRPHKKTKVDDEPETSKVQSGGTVMNMKVLSFVEDMELGEAENGGRPSVRKVKDNQDPEEAATQELFRQVRRILNKLKPEKFGQLMKQLEGLSINTAAQLDGISKMVLEKAICETKFTSTYAKMCCKLKELTVPCNNGILPLNFQSLMLDLCQKEVCKVTGDGAALEMELQNQRAAKLEDRQNLQELEAKVTADRKRAVGSMKFMGELFKLGMVKDGVILEYITNFLDTETEEALESLCCLITTTGSILDSKELKPVMDRHFSRIKSILKEKKLAWRVCLDLQDLTDLRQNDWVPRMEDQGPKTIQEIDKEVEEESQLAAEEVVSQQVLCKMVESCNTTPEEIKFSPIKPWQFSKTHLVHSVETARNLKVLPLVKDMELCPVVPESELRLKSESEPVVKVGSELAMESESDLAAETELLAGIDSEEVKETESEIILLASESLGSEFSEQDKPCEEQLRSALQTETEPAAEAEPAEESRSEHAVDRDAEFPVVPESELWVESESEPLVKVDSELAMESESDLAAESELVAGIDSEEVEIESETILLIPNRETQGAVRDVTFCMDSEHQMAPDRTEFNPAMELAREVLEEYFMGYCAATKQEGQEEEEALECLCRLLSTIGRKMDIDRTKCLIDKCMRRLGDILKEGKTSNRIRLIIQDIMDLRRNNWAPRDGNQESKATSHVHKDAELENQQEGDKVEQQLVHENSKTVHKHTSEQQRTCEEHDNHNRGLKQHCREHQGNGRPQRWANRAHQGHNRQQSGSNDRHPAHEIHRRWKHGEHNSYDQDLRRNRREHQGCTQDKRWYPGEHEGRALDQRWFHGEREGRALDPKFYHWEHQDRAQDHRLYYGEHQGRARGQRWDYEGHQGRDQDQRWYHGEHQGHAQNRRQHHGEHYYQGQHEGLHHGEHHKQVRHLRLHHGEHQGHAQDQRWHHGEHQGHAQSRRPHHGEQYYLGQHKGLHHAEHHDQVRHARLNHGEHQGRAQNWRRPHGQHYYQGKNEGLPHREHHNQVRHPRLHHGERQGHGQDQRWHHGEREGRAQDQRWYHGEHQGRAQDRRQLHGEQYYQGQHEGLHHGEQHEQLRHLRLHHREHHFTPRLQRHQSSAC